MSSISARLKRQPSAAVWLAAVTDEALVCKLCVVLLLQAARAARQDKVKISYFMVVFPKNRVGRGQLLLVF